MNPSYLTYWLFKVTTCPALEIYVIHVYIRPHIAVREDANPAFDSYSLRFADGFST